MSGDLDLRGVDGVYVAPINIVPSADPPVPGGPPPGGTGAAMSDHAALKAWLVDERDRLAKLMAEAPSEIREAGLRPWDERIAAVDALVAERDEWKRHYEEARELSGDDQTRAEAAEARVEQLEAALREARRLLAEEPEQEVFGISIRDLDPIVENIDRALASSGSEGARTNLVCATCGGCWNMTTTSCDDCGGQQATTRSSGSEGDAACPYACQTNDNANTPCPHCDA